MSYIKLTDGTKYPITTNGAYPSGTALVLTISTTDTIADLQTIFADATLTATIGVYSDDDVQITTDYEGYTVLKRISLDLDNGTATINLSQPEVTYATTDDIDTLSDAIAELAEIVGGE